MIDYKFKSIYAFVSNKIIGGIRCVKEHGLSYTIFYAVKRTKNYLKTGLVKLYQKIKRLHPMVSIIIPVFNVENYIEQALETLINQSENRIEIIIVDDGSTDGTMQILKRYQAKDKRLRVYQQKNQYAGVARNVGMDKARGKYVLFLDGDDFFSTDLIKEAYYAAEMNHADAVLFGAKNYNSETKEYQDANWYLRTDLLPEKQPFSYKDCAENFYLITTPNPWTKMFRRKFVKENRLKFQAIHNSNDLFFIFTALLMAKRIVTVDKTLVFYRVGLNSNLQTTKYREPLSFYDAYKAWHDKLVELDVLDEVRYGYVNMIVTGCIYNLNTTRDSAAKKIVFEALKNEIFETLEVLGYKKEYYCDEYAYGEMVYIMENSFEEYRDRVC